jgi:integrase
VKDVYIPEQQSNLTKRSMERTRGILNIHLIPAFNGPMSAITHERISLYKNERLESASKDTVRKELQILKQILSQAIKLGKLAGKNPFDLVRLPAPSPHRVRYIGPVDFSKILAGLDERYQLAAIFLVNTGARRSEMLNLRWSDVDLVQGIISIRNTKGKSQNVVRHARINEELRAVFERVLRNITDDRVFWFITKDGLSWAFRQATRAAGVKDFRLHDLRHTFASVLHIKGIDLDVLSRLLGHADIRMTQRYSHLTPEALRAATQGIDGLFGLKHELEEKERIN